MQALLEKVEVVITTFVRFDPLAVAEMKRLAIPHPRFMRRLPRFFYLGVWRFGFRFWKQVQDQETTLVPAKASCSCLFFLL